MKPLARWNPARSVWETNETLICGHSDVWSETWPSSGMWADGQVYALPTSAPLTAGSASSSLPGPLVPTPLNADAGPRGGTTGFGLRDWSRNLPTPTSRDWKGANQRQDDTCLTGALLPTPTVSDTNGAGAHGTGGPDLRTALSLLPTPTATPYGNNQSPSPGAAVRPSLDTLAPMLLPTPMAGDAKAARNSTATRHKIPPTGIHAGNTLTDVLVPPTGGRTGPPLSDGNAA